MSSFVETTEEEENNKQKKKAELWWTKAKISTTERDTRTHTHNNKKKKDAPCGSDPGLVSSRVLSHKCIPTWKAHQMMWTQRLCVKVMARLPGKQHLYTTLGTVNICTVKAREFNPSSSSSSPFFKSPFFFFALFSPLISTWKQNNKSTGKKTKTKRQYNKALLSCVCCRRPLAIAVSQLVFCFSWQERRTVPQSDSQKTS